MMTVEMDDSMKEVYKVLKVFVNRYYYTTTITTTTTIITATTTLYCYMHVDGWTAYSRTWTRMC